MTNANTDAAYAKRAAARKAETKRETALIIMALDTQQSWYYTEAGLYTKAGNEDCAKECFRLAADVAALKAKMQNH